MREHQVQEIIDCLPTSRTLFHYFRDRYALMLLSYSVGDGMSVRELKRSSLAPLLQKPAVRDVLARLDGTVVTRELLDSYWPAQPEAYVLTLGRWGDYDAWYRSWDQTSRRGYNLVLQVNFSDKHDQGYRKLLNPGECDVFNCPEHPVNKEGRNTLAWARLDIELDAGECLIEEIQSDWIQGRLWRSTDPYINRTGAGQVRLGELRVEARKLRKYVGRVLKPHRKLWDEATLAAAIWFLKEELGITRIYYHSFKSETRLKGFSPGESSPPRSLYTALPRKFCFRETLEAPRFLQKEKEGFLRYMLRHGGLRWFLLEL